MAKKKIIKLSATRINSFLQCKLKYWFNLIVISIIGIVLVEEQLMAFSQFFVRSTKLMDFME